MKKLILILLLLPSCQAVRNYREARAINDNIELTERWLNQYKQP